MNMYDRDALVRERYGEASVEANLSAVLDPLFLQHRSVRAYRDTPLPEGTIESLVAAAQSASTSSNLQAWSVVSVESAETRSRLSELAGGQKHVASAPVQLVWLADLSRLHQAAADQGISAEGVDYLEVFLVSVIDAAIAAQSAALAAESLDLGLVYIGGLRNHPEEVAELLGLPDRCFAVFGMCIGYPDETKPAHIKPRLPQAAVWHREKYDAAGLAEHVEAYDLESLRFYQSQNMDRKQWSIHSGNRVRGPESLNGRDRLAEALNRLGFPLR
ncbi:NADPH-dependent oxidoreductase [Natronospirillum operosum]|uniref:NADPH-dependent oxidoreductase n=1 Tax=Natronospirillum operosum TaxID=2759953 RepID=A0A4Z0W868_9GAMM|nr:nitroreductase family protein [Natronospirillum operosum]TGG93597.1 NADPH-dependent oxidoreductase [Natronospirillum operosum]